MLRKPTLNALRACRILLLSAALTSCATSRDLKERYLELEPDARSEFLAYYPSLTPEERDSWLDHRTNVTLLRSEADQNPEIAKRIERLANFRDRPGSFRILGIEITPSTHGPIQSGNRLKLRATLRYADGASIDATDDVEWSIQPALASIKEDTVSFGCIHSDVIATANFLDERTGSQNLYFRKPLKALRASVNDGWKGPKPGEYVQLKAVAECEDGSTTDVTCQTSWNFVGAAPRGVDLLGCGNLQFHSIRNRIGAERLRPIKVRAEYGEHSAVFEVTPP